MKKIKLLFQGDSITDASRNREDPHHLGNGYPKYAAALLAQQHPEIEFEFIDLGISGNQTKDLVARLQADFIDVNPDIVSLMIGVNDVWHYSDTQWLSDAVFEERLERVLKAIKEETRAKLMILEPFLVPGTEKDFFREDLWRKIEIVRKMARKYADVYLPTDGLLQAAFVGDDPLSYAADGVHPTPKGAEFIGTLYAQYIQPLL